MIKLLVFELQQPRSGRRTSWRRYFAVLTERSIRLARDGFFHHVASYGYTPEQDQFMNEHPVPAAKPGLVFIVGRVQRA